MRDGWIIQWICHFLQLKTGIDNIPFLTIPANVLVRFCIFCNVQIWLYFQNHFLLDFGKCCFFLWWTCVMLVWSMACWGVSFCFLIVVVVVYAFAFHYWIWSVCHPQPATVFVADIEGVQNEVICLWIATACSMNVART